MSINNMSYDIIYFAAGVTWIQLGGNEQLFAFSPGPPAVVQEAAVLCRMLQRNCEQL